MQDNQLHGNLTVEEAMKVATSLKLSSDLSKRDKEEVVSGSLWKNDGPDVCSFINSFTFFRVDTRNSRNLRFTRSQKNADE